MVFHYSEITIPTLKKLRVLNQTPHTQHPKKWTGHRLWAVACTIAALSAISPANAAEGSREWVSGETLIELHGDWAANSNNADNERSDIHTKIETSLNARLSKNLAGRSLLVFEPVRDPAPGRSRALEDHGLHAQELFLEYHRNGYAVRAGKFGQKFGIAWAAAAGIWGTDFAEDYELSDQIGLAGDIPLDGAGGKHVLTIGTFFHDTTVLSKSAFTNRGHTRHADGGAGNTEDFSSYSISLEGAEFTGVPGLGYHISHTYRDAEGPGETSEKGYAVAVTYVFRARAFEIVPLVEYVYFENHDGTKGTNADYLTTSLGIAWNKWNLALSRTGRETRSSGSEVDDSLAQISIGYLFDSGIGVNAGYRHILESGVNTDSYGLMTDYTLKF